jgi:hypothetical protein
MRTDFPNHYVAAILALHHEPLRQWYDAEFFQRHIDHSGIHQLGGYAPYPPLTMLPFLPLAHLPPQRAKQVWLLFELACLAASILLLSRLTKLGLLETSVLALLAYASLATNFLLGHYYIFLLLLLAAAVACLLRGRDLAAGALFGLIFMLKLYAAPFALFFAIRKQWRALLAMLATVALLTIATAAIFGADAVLYFATHVMPRAADAEIVDPYSPAFGSMSVLLHRLFLAEPSLNPHPWINSPHAFFFFETFFTAGLTIFGLLALPRKSSLADDRADARATAFWIVMLFALSPITAFSHYILLLVPIVLLLPRASVKWSAGLIALYILVQLPERPCDSWLFPRLWFTLALLLYIGWPLLRAIRPRTALVALTAVTALSVTAAIIRTPPPSADPAAFSKEASRAGAILSTAPAISNAGLIYESMESDRYALRTLDREFHFDGDAFHPTVLATGTAIYFELASARGSHIAKFDPATGNLDLIQGAEGIEPAISPDGSALAFVSGDSLVVLRDVLHEKARSILATGQISTPAFFPDNQSLAYAEGFPGRRVIHVKDRTADLPLTHEGDCFEPSVSPDGARLAFACSDPSGSQIWIMNLASHTRQPLTQGACNHTWPAWSPDSRSIVFASDCGRGFGFPALFSLRVDIDGPAR